MNYLKLYLLTTPIYLIIDLIWLGIISKNFYQKHLGFILNPNPNKLAAAIFYFTFMIGLIIFCIFPALEKNSLNQAIVLGILFGFFTYAAYDLTNLATIKNWPVIVTLVDLLWGMFISGIIASIGFLISQKLK